MRLSPNRPPLSAALACATRKSHAPLRGEEGRYASNCVGCAAPIENITVKHSARGQAIWASFLWTHLIFEEPA